MGRPDTVKGRAARFINNLTHTKGKWAGRPFALRPWQAQDIIAPIFDTLRPDGRRQYRTVYIEVPRKNGKSEIAAAIALYMLLGDYEYGAEVYSAAADKEQASLVFNVAAQMVRNDEQLANMVRIVDSQKRIVFYKTGSFYRAISAEAYSKHGFNASAIIYDELHAAPNRELYDVLTTSTAAREQPLTILITTAGYDKNSICYELHEYACKVRDGIISDPTFLPIIFAAEEGDDWKDPQTWYKANPALGDFRSLEEMQEKFSRAVEVPAYENVFKRLYLNIWTEQEARWLDMDAYDNCPVYDAALLEGRQCYVAVDLSTKVDLTAVVAVFPPPAGSDDEWHVLAYFFMPAENLAKREHVDKVPYSEWVKQGYIVLTEGNVIDYGYIENFIVALSEKYHVTEIGYDPWNATQFALNMQARGYMLTEMRQGTKTLCEPTKKLEALIVARKLVHYNNPVLRWQASNVSVKSDTNGNYMPKKPEHGSTFRIDGIVAAVMGIGLGINKAGEAYSEGLIVL